METTRTDSPSRLYLSFWVQMHHDLVCDELRLDLRGIRSVHRVRWIFLWELWWALSSDVARSGLAGDVARAIRRNVRCISPVVDDRCWGVIMGGVSRPRRPPTYARRIGSPHFGYCSLPLFLLRAAARQGEFFEIAFRVLSAGGGDFVRAFAVEATRDATAWIHALDGLRVVWKDAVALGALVMVWRGPTRRESCGLRFSGN